MWCKAMVAIFTLCVPLLSATAAGPEKRDAAALPVKSYAQELVDQVLAGNPKLLMVTLRTATPELPDYPIVASNIGRLGKVADADDMPIIVDGKTVVEATPDGERLEVGLPLHEINGNNIGALRLLFALHAGGDKSAVEKAAIRIRDAMARRILSAESLVEPHPLDPAATTKTHAQKIVEQVYARHRDLNLIGMHVKTPEREHHTIIASTFGRIGKKTDEEWAALGNGKIGTEVKAKGKRFGVQLPLADASGKAIGAMTIGYPLKPSDDKDALVTKAIAVRDEIQALIPSLQSLVELDP